MTRTKRGRGTGGFTLVELLIVLAVLSILATAALGPRRGNSVTVLKGHARLLAADLRQARALAIQYGTEYTVRFETAENRYTVVHTGSGTAPALVDPLRPASSGDYVFDFDTDAAGLGNAGSVSIADLTLVTTKSAITEIVFGSHGGTGPARTEDTRVRLSIRSTNGITVVPVEVSWVTGRVVVGAPELSGSST